MKRKSRQSYFRRFIIRACPVTNCCATNNVARRFVTGFTLIEIMVSLVVFAMLMAAMGSVFYKIYKDWQKQRDYGLVMENGRWAMELMAREIKCGHADSNVTTAGESPLNTGELLDFLIDPAGGGNPHNKKIYYWKGKSGCGEPYVLYRSMVNWNQDFTQAQTSARRRELTRFLVDGPEIFNVSGCAVENCTVVMNLTLRPKPGQPEGAGNRNVYFRTLVRPRN